MVHLIWPGTTMFHSNIKNKIVSEIESSLSLSHERMRLKQEESHVPHGSAGSKGWAGATIESTCASFFLGDEEPSRQYPQPVHDT